MTYPTQYPLYIFAVSFLALWVAARIGSSFKEIVKERRDDFAAIMTTTFTLLGLIVGFTFSMAVTRYDQRKIFEEAEANAIGTEYARVGLLPDCDATMHAGCFGNMLNSGSCSIKPRIGNSSAVSMPSRLACRRTFGTACKLRLRPTRQH
jgi:hypothetical protein